MRAGSLVVLGALLGCGEASFVSLGRNDARDAEPSDAEQSQGQGAGSSAGGDDGARDAASPDPVRDAAAELDAGPNL